MRGDEALVAMGANLPSWAGPPVATLKAALSDLQARDTLRVTAISRFFVTPAFPAGSGPDYANACLRLQTGLEPEALLDVLHEVEARFGRRRLGERWVARSMDLDLLAVGDTVLPDPQTVRHWQDLPLEAQKSQAPARLILPHPRMQDRAFVLVPLADIAGTWRHPLSGLSVARMLASLPEAERAAIRPVQGS